MDKDEQDKIDGRKIKEAYKTALRKREQPRCPFCGEDLELLDSWVHQLTWTWNRQRRRYEKEWDFVYNGSADAEARCLMCGKQSDMFYEYSRLCRRLGIVE